MNTQKSADCDTKFILKFCSSSNGAMKKCTGGKELKFGTLLSKLSIEIKSEKLLYPDLRYRGLRLLIVRLFRFGLLIGWNKIQLFEEVIFFFVLHLERVSKLFMNTKEDLFSNHLLYFLCRFIQSGFSLSSFPW